ncbi:MAG TPA: ATP-binding cassette domain-containing protein [Firmicutes bacterium]|nr:ATP-binding cassette domain-containing protein [Bacillota bacterium]
MIDLIDVSFEYENGTRALSHVDLKINSGEFAFVVGASGAGKSSLLKLLTRETVTTSGKVFVNGFDLNRIKKKHIPKFRRSLGMIFQDFRLIPTMNVFDNVAFGLRVTDHSAKYIRNRVPYVLDLVDLKGKEKMRTNQLSGGEQQRVAIARALANDPPLIIADEPTGNIDPGLSLQIVELLIEINYRCGTTILMVTHEHDLVRYFGGRTISIENGEVTFDDYIKGTNEAWWQNHRKD